LLFFEKYDKIKENYYLSRKFMSIEVKKDSNDLLEARKKYFFVGDSHMAGIL
jgi:hypothetical protein